MDVSPEEQLAELDQQVTPLLRQRDGLARDWARIEEVRSRRNRFAGLPMDLDRPGRGGFLRVYVGYVPQRSLETLIQQLAPPTTLWHHPVQADRLAVVIATTSSRQAAVDQALREAGFEAETRLNQAGLPDDTPSRSNQGPSVDASPHRNLREEGLRLSRAFRQADDKIRFPLLRLEHQAETERLIVEARRLCPRTESTVLFTGWIPAAERPVVEGALTRITGGSLALEFSRPRRRRGETAPTLLRSPAWLRPFTPLVTGFGHPGYHEIVPTPFVALSYPLMFGAMFGDVGHGGILALAGMVFALTRKEARHRQAGWLLGIAGLSAVVFGWLYGSCFGLQAFKGHALWHDPLEADPARLMLGAVAIGVGLISLGLVLNIVNRLRRFDVTGALLDKFGLAGLLFYWGAIGLLAFPASPLAALSGSTLALVIAIPLVAWTLKGPIDHLLHRRSHPDEPGEDLGSVLAESAVGTFEGLLQFLANTLSFVRLAAYALSHAALLMATFSLAAQVGQSPVLGPAGAWAIIVLGNLITLVLEAIVASVQALRLEYYEFFGKFFAGDGRPFEPFRLRPVPLASNLPATS